MAYKEKPLYFQVLKWMQFTFTFLVFILEMTEFGACLNYIGKMDEYENPPAPNPFLIFDSGSRWAKRYVYLVFSISIFSVSFYLAKFQGAWTEKNGPYFLFELYVPCIILRISILLDANFSHRLTIRSLLILWISESFTNLYDIFNNAPSNYTSYLNQRSTTVPQLPQEPLTAYATYIASITFGFLNSLAFMMSTFIAYKVKKEKCLPKVRNVRKVKLIKFAQKSGTKDVTFVRTESHSSVNEKIVGFKGFVEVKIDDGMGNEKKDEISDDDATLYDAYGNGSKDRV
ncbi:5093_t:CDS:2 [Acaulospora morrowiae]|uniref:5093_t:CDS:1 n=1 Tax=Acaulospora morrowiae TaxID=94023 RepID=A0A9N8VDV3_9GLOM|nr:5093_t:CDS:2 [Acaulospora morrowiae]